MYEMDRAFMSDCLNESFIMCVKRKSWVEVKPSVQEFYTTAGRVSLEARRCGHTAGKDRSLETGCDFFRKADRNATLLEVRGQKPWLLVLALPCSPDSPLQNLRRTRQTAERQARHEILVNFAVQLAYEQMSHGRHFVIENPDPFLRLENLQSAEEVDGGFESQDSALRPMPLRTEVGSRWFTSEASPRPDLQPSHLAAAE